MTRVAKTADELNDTSGKCWKPYFVHTVPVNLRKTIGFALNRVCLIDDQRHVKHESVDVLLGRPAAFSMHVPGGVFFRGRRDQRNEKTGVKLDRMLEAPLIVVTRLQSLLV